MAIFTLCSKLVKYCNCQTLYWKQILLPFLEDDFLRIAIDDNKRALDVYTDLDDIENGMEIRIWIDMLNKLRSEDVWEIVTVDSEDFSDNLDLFLEICSKTVGNKELFCKSKQDYAGKISKLNKVQLLDRSEAVIRIRNVRNEIRGQDMKIINSTIITGTVVKSIVGNANAFNEAQKDDLQNILEEVGKLVSESREERPHELFQLFGEEIQKPAPRKHVLMSCWDGLVNSLPALIKMTDIVDKVTDIFEKF